MTRLIVLVGLVLASLSMLASSALGAGGYGCRRLSEPLVGQYEIVLLNDLEDLEAAAEVERIVRAEREFAPALFADAEIVVRSIPIEAVGAAGIDEIRQETATLDRDHQLFIAVGNVESISAVFDALGVRNGVAVPPRDGFAAIARSTEPPIPERPVYYQEMLRHSVYRGLLQLNGEQPTRVSAIGLDHIQASPGSALAIPAVAAAAGD